MTKPQQGGAAGGETPKTRARTGFIIALSLGLLFGAAFSPSRAVADERPPAPRIWMHDALGRLGVLDLADGAFTMIGPMGVVLTDLAFAPDGQLYGLTFNEFFKVGRDGSLTRIGRHGVPCGNALEIGPDGIGYAMGCSGDGLYSVNLATGYSELLFRTGYRSAGDLAWRGGALMLAARDFGSDRLVELDLKRGAALDVGPFGVGNVYGLATGPDGRLYAGAGAAYYAVDALSGRAARLGDYAEAGLAEVYGWAIERDFEPLLMTRSGAEAGDAPPKCAAKRLRSLEKTAI